MRTLVALSGGLNSVVALWWYLTETCDEVHAHHIVFGPARRKAEAAAVAAAVKYTRAVRPFTFTQSERMTSMKSDVVVVSDELGRLVKGGIIPRPDRMVRGSRLLEEVEPSRTSRRREALAVWQEHVPGAELTCHPTSDMTRAQQIAMLPSELVEVVISCRRPVKRGAAWGSCLSCETCKEFVGEGIQPLPRKPLAEGAG